MRPHKPALRLASAVAAALIILAAGQACRSRGGPLAFACRPNNDLYSALAAAGEVYPRFDNPAEAIAGTRTGGAVLLLADGYPEKRVELSPGALEEAARKRLRIYVEYPAALPGIDLGAPRTAAWERAVVTGEGLGADLPPMSLLAVHACRYLPVRAANPEIVLARVAGYGRAVFGLPKEYFPLLFDWQAGRALVATTKLSGFIRARYAPAAGWQTVWQFILKKLDPDHAPHALRWTPAAHASYGPLDNLPPDFESRAFSASVHWLSASKLLRSASRKAEIEKALRTNGETGPAPPATTRPSATALSASLRATPRASSPTAPSSSACRSVTIARGKRRCFSPSTRRFTRSIRAARSPGVSSTLSISTRTSARGRAAIRVTPPSASSPGAQPPLSGSSPITATITPAPLSAS